MNLPGQRDPEVFYVYEYVSWAWVLRDRSSDEMLARTMFCTRIAQRKLPTVLMHGDDLIAERGQVK